MHTPSRRILSALADERGEEFDPRWRSRLACSTNGNGSGVALVAELVVVHVGDAINPAPAGRGDVSYQSLPLDEARTLVRLLLGRGEEPAIGEWGWTGAGVLASWLAWCTRCGATRPSWCGLRWSGRLAGLRGQRTRRRRRVRPRSLLRRLAVR